MTAGFGECAQQALGNSNPQNALWAAWDGDGLYIQVQKTGSRNWVFVYRRGKSSTEIGLGGYDSAHRVIKLLERHPAAASLSPREKSKLTEIIRLYDECTLDCIALRLAPYE